MTQDEFASTVKRMIDLQEKMTEIAAQVKQTRTPIKEQVDDLKERVKAYMEKEGAETVNYHDYQLKVATVTKYGSLTRKTLRPALDAFFRDEKKGQECFDFIVAQLGSQDTTVLRKTKRRKTGGAGSGPGKGKQAQSSANPLAEPALDDDDQAPELSDDE